MLTNKYSAGLWIEKRMCEDYRPLNLVDRYPMPILEELFDSIGDSNIFTIMDMRQGFNQIVLVAKDRKKKNIPWKQQVVGMACDAFWIEECICFLSTSHGPGSQRGIFPKIYIDDVQVHSKGLLEHLAHLEELFKRLHESNMKIHPKKCEFVVTLVIYLGHRILPNGIMAH